MAEMTSAEQRAYRAGYYTRMGDKQLAMVDPRPSPDCPDNIVRAWDWGYEDARMDQIERNRERCR